MPRVAEPNLYPRTLCWAEQEASEEHRCAYCDAAEVSNPGEYCSLTCAELAAQEAADDAALNLQRETEH